MAEELILYQWQDSIFASNIPLLGLHRVKKIANRKVTASIFAVPAKLKKQWILISRRGHRYKVYQNKNHYFICGVKQTPDIADFVTHHVLPMILASKGQTILHGASLFKKKKHFLILGKSGVGKSTFCAFMQKKAWHLNGDESQALEFIKKKVIAHSLAPTHRHFQKKSKRKKILTILKQKKSPPLTGLILLEKSKAQQMAFTELKIEKAFLKLLQQTFIHPHLSPNARRKIFSQLHLLATQCPIFLVRYPHNKRNLRNLKSLIENLSAA